MIHQKKARIMLQTYLILCAAQKWNKHEEKSKEDANALIKRLKQIPYAGCIVSHFSDYFRAILQKLDLTLTLKK